MKKIFDLINRNLLRPVKRFSDSSPSVLPLITIAREKGSGGRPVAYLVAKKLGNPWEVYHEQVVAQIAKETDLNEELIKEVDERNIPLIEEIVADFFGKKYMSLGSYHKHLLKILSTIGHRGHAIVVGRGARFLFPEGLKIGVIAERTQRIEWMMQFEKISQNEAIKRIDTADKERYEFIKSVYNRDPRNIHDFDLIIKTGKYTSIEDAANVIVSEARRRFKL
ncbi:MAG: cytidylate kinase-like family protein [bacterium]|nr:cytidylate kinase-like family protein [bacterium]